MLGSSLEQRVQKAFSDSAGRYEAFSGLQREIGRRLVGRMGRLPADGRILDVGMGTGLATDRLARAYPGRRVVGMDFAAGMVARAAQYGSFAALQADAAALPFADGSFDAVFSNLAYQWVENMPAAWGRAYAVLRDPGVLCAALFAGETLRELFESLGRTSPLRYRGPAPRRLASPGAVDAALRQAGFAGVCVEEELIQTHFDNMLALLRWLKRTGANTPAVRMFVGKDWLEAAGAYYRRTFGDGRGVYATFQVVWVRAEKRKKGQGTFV